MALNRETYTIPAATKTGNFVKRQDYVQVGIAHLRGLSPASYPLASGSLHGQRVHVFIVFAI